jgi:3-hydroxyacyl-CoA dehydrogenase
MSQTITSSSLVRIEVGDGVAIVTLDNPPVNALSFGMSAALIDGFDALEADAGVRAVIVTGAGGLFSGGADITEFLAPPPADAKNVRDLIARIEKSKKTVVAAIDGNALGGGSELALACDYRIATKRSKLGFPEIKLGLIPGAGGTQRLPRLIGPQPALQLMLEGNTIAADAAKMRGMLDDVVESDVVAAATARLDAWIASKPKRRISEMNATVLPFMVAWAHKMVPAEEAGGMAAHKLIDAVEASTQLPFPQGLAREFRLFEELVVGEQARSLMHVFFAERELGKIPGLPPAPPNRVTKAAIVGAGTMGTGIAITFANAGIPVWVLDIKPEQLERGKETLAKTLASQVAKGRLTADEAAKRGALVSFAGDYDAIADVDLVIEAVFENMDVKKEVFRALDRAVKADAILATNTSTLDVDEIASATTRPGNVVGMHFFSPANVMKLLEVVRGTSSSAAALATAMGVGKMLRKTSVLSGNAFGFIGNSMFFDYAREATYLIEEGALPQQVDAVLERFGFAMGPFRTFDLAGVDVSWRIEQEHPQTVGRQSQLVDRLYHAGRYGQKTGSGYYTYEKGRRDAIPDPQFEAMLLEESQKLGITRRQIPEDEILERCLYPLIDRGARLLGDGIALRPGDIDIVWIFGYGFPPHRGGPMWYADTVGTKKIYERILEFKARLGSQWEPAPLLATLAQTNATFAGYRKVK